MGVEQREQLSTMGWVLGIVDVEDDPAWHFGVAVSDPLGIAAVLDAGGKALGNPKAPVDLGQDQNPDIIGQLAAVEGGVNRLAADRWHAGLKLGNLLHGGCNFVRSWLSCLNAKITHYIR